LKAEVLAMSILSIVWAFALTGCGGSASGGDTKNMVYGSPESKLSMVPVSGPLYEGPALSIAPEVKPAPNATEHRVRIDVSHSEVIVNDTIKFVGWVFGGGYPGPVLHIRQGDKVYFKMTNRSNETVGFSPPSPHSIDFHAAMVNPKDKYREVIPGATIEFEWTANYPGVYMYHCGSPAILQHMIYGMIGTAIVEPKDCYPTKVDREYVLIQSELYLSRLKSGMYVTDMATAKKKDPMFVCFNGQPFRHVKEPLKAKAGERVRLYLLNAGPNGTSSFHVVGTLFDRVWIEGHPQNEMRGVATVMLPSSGAAIVEFIVPEKGIYTFVDHEFADVEAGAAGLIDASEEAVAVK
jgi:nitrite reductase (NO-forming)